MDFFILERFPWIEALAMASRLSWGLRTRSCQKAVVVKAEAMLQHSKKYSNGRQFLERERSCRFRHDTRHNSELFTQSGTREYARPTSDRFLLLSYHQ